MAEHASAPPPGRDPGMTAEQIARDIARRANLAASGMATIHRHALERWLEHHVAAALATATAAAAEAERERLVGALRDADATIEIMSDWIVGHPDHDPGMAAQAMLMRQEIAATISRDEGNDGEA